MLFVLISSSQEQGWPMKGLSPYPCPRRCRISSPRVLGIGASVLPGEYRVYARFHAFIDILTEAGIVGITDQADQAGPSTIILSPDLPSDWVSTVQSVSITETTLSLDSLVLPIEGAQRYRETLQLPELPVPIDLQPALMLFQKILLSEAPEKSMAVVLDHSRTTAFSGNFDRIMLQHFLDGAEACWREEYGQAVASLLGSGYGLTPSGDDFLCGVLFGMHFANATNRKVCPIHQLSTHLRAALPTCSVFSRTFLDHAIAGRWPLALRDAAEAILSVDTTTPDGQTRLETLFRRVLAHGSTSGSDLASGFILTAGRYSGFSPSFVSWHKERNNGA